mmetsp:Transcript_59550/g.94180  ORF Transcript_59550/g.94180 Transcript_59550/m.94180 type:complete len:240 (+) Transcript_59550:765-1484(+)
MKLCLEPTAFSFLCWLLVIKLLQTLPKNVIIRSIVPTPAQERCLDILAGGAAVIFVNVALKTGRTAKTPGGMVALPRLPCSFLRQRCCQELRWCGGHILQRISDGFSEWLTCLGPALLVDLMSHMHDIGALGVHQIERQSCAGEGRERDIQGDIQVLSILILIYQHLILCLRCQEISQFCEEKSQDQAKRADGNVATNRSLHLKLLHGPCKGIEGPHSKRVRLMNSHLISDHAPHETTP